MVENARLRPVAEGVWFAEAPVSFLGLRLASNMTVMRLAGGGLVVVSPVPLDPALQAEVDALGRVAHLVAPNVMHHLAVGDWAAAYPEARLHAPAALARKRRDLRIDRRLGEAAEPAFGGEVEELPVEGFRLDETALFHLPSRTLVVADLVHNIGRPTHGWTRFYTRTMGFYDRVALSRVIRWTAFSDRKAARRSLDRLLAWAPAQIVVGHGPPLGEGAAEALAAAYTWLPAAPG